MLHSDALSSDIIDPRAQSPLELLQLCSDRKISSVAARRLLGAAIGEQELRPEVWLTRGILRKESACYLADLPRLTLEQTVVSPIDNFQKVLFRTPDGFPIETVLIPLHKPGAVSLCLSSQVGCVMGCAFCATARMPQRRNLKTWEIVDQYLQARTLVEASGRRVTGVVFMGMGEPFLNYERVIAAAKLLCFPVRNAISGRSITVSTVGILDKIERFTAENHPFRLSISIGSAFDHKRAKLLPVAARTPIAELMAAARRHALARKDRINLAYVCVGGENVGEEDARELGAIVGDTPIRLDLIEVTDPTGNFARPTAQEMNTFRDALRKYLGQPVARRYSGGADIQAACGTLAGQSTPPSLALINHL